jgi:hypothetical protein
VGPRRLTATRRQPGPAEAALSVSREQILAYRRRVQALDDRLPRGPDSLRRAAWAGLQDSVPRSALHALHARVEDVGPHAWEDPALVQVWGPRYAAYVVPQGAHEPFTLGRIPARGRTRERAIELAAGLDAYLHGRRLPADEVAVGLGLRDNSLRYASLTGMVLIRWGGARQPVIRMTRPTMDEPEARLELIRRYLHVYGPTTATSLVRWGGLDAPSASAAFEALRPSLVVVRSPLGEGYILADDESLLRAPAQPTAAARLLPSGDPYYLLWGADRDLLVPDPSRRDRLWTPRVWPGALLVAGEIVGTWRRAKATIVVEPWRKLNALERDALEDEAANLPLPGTTSAAAIVWAGPGRS